MLLTSSWIIDSAIILTSLIYLLYKYFTRNFDYWKKEGVFYFKPTPFFGNFYGVVTMKTSLADTLKTLYDKTDEPYFGAFTFDEPILVVKSPQLLKHILIKDFTYFKHRTFAEGSHNKIISNWLFFQKYTAWKQTRSKLSLMFTSGKLRNMFHSISNTSALFAKYLNDNLGVLEAKEICMRYTTESTVKCFFGINGKCFEKGHSELNEISKRIFEMSLRNGIIHSFYTFKPFLVDLFRLNFMRQADVDYLLEAFKTSYNSRKTTKNGSKGKIVDYIDIMLESEDSNGTSKSDYDSDYFMAMANTIQFYIGGIETSAGSLSFTLYEWAMNLDIQEKARKEVFDIMKKYDKITYDCLQEMEYIDMCLAETGRKYPLFQLLDRRADMDYKFPDTNLIIKKGTKIYIPFYALHMDEKYFPDPQKYNPERFLDKTINSDGVYYMPFGAGPRICLGERFAMMSMKIFLATFLRSFKVETCDKTPNKITFDPNSFTIVSKDGIYLRFKRLNEN